MFEVGDKVKILSHHGSLAKDYVRKVGTIAGISQKGGQPLYYVVVPGVPGSAALRSWNIQLAVSYE